MLLMDIGPVVKAMKYPSIDLNEETHPLLWQYENGHIRVFIVFITELVKMVLYNTTLTPAGFHCLYL